jgi:uncharacterized protein (TIGR02001 family)
MSPRKIAVATLLSLGLVAAGGAHAQVSGSLTLTSDYLFRGLSQSGEDPALQGGIEYAHDSGFYVGGWGSSVSWLSDADPDVSNSLELDAYAGFRGTFGDSEFGYDVGGIYYWYPGDYPPGFFDPDTGELYAGLTYSLFGLKYSYAVTDLFGLPDSDGSSALELSANWEFVDTWTLNAGAAKQWVSGYDGLDYAYWKVGVTKAFESGFSVAAAYNDNDLIGPDETLTLTVTKAF